MKRRLFIRFLFGLALLAACTSPKRSEPAERLSQALQAIDSLMWRQPDSALAQLQQFVVSPAADSLDEFNGHYCQLLISELLYKNYAAQTNRKELLEAVAYFDSLGSCTDVVRNVSTVFLDARAHYINGVGYYERDSVVEACKEYLKALEVMDEWIDGKDIVGQKAKFMAFACTRLTVLFSDHYLHDPAIYFGKISLRYYKKSNDSSWHLAWMFDEIGSHYDILEIVDSATYYYDKGLNLLSESKDNLTYRDLSTHLAYLYIRKGNLQHLL